MNILMLTNTFVPYVGGVARSVQRFVDEYRRQGHRVLVAAPSYKQLLGDERDVIRFPAIQHFNGTEFSLPMPVPGRRSFALRQFKADVVHVHHPFALGGTALRISSARGVPLVFTHHTMYEKYTHYIPGDSLRLKRYVVSLVRGYCNYCDAVIAPSESVARLLRSRGVETPISVIPTGVETLLYRSGDGVAFRGKRDIPADAFVIGHVGRMATEKNLEFLARAVALFLRRRPNAYFLLVGVGPMTSEICKVMDEMGVGDRFRPVGLLQPTELSVAYKSMDAFAFSSHTETQGMVLAEAMAAGVPVVAIDASGVREVVEDKVNGRLLAGDDESQFASALEWIVGLSPDQKLVIKEAACATAKGFDISRTANQTLERYRALIELFAEKKHRKTHPVMRAKQGLKSEWQIMSNIGRAMGNLIHCPKECLDDPLNFGISASAGASDQ